MSFLLQQQKMRVLLQQQKMSVLLQQQQKLSVLLEQQQKMSVLPQQQQKMSVLLQQQQKIRRASYWAGCARDTYFLIRHNTYLQRYTEMKTLCPCSKKG